MSKNTINPFNITKSVDYSDIEIFNNWVELTSNKTFLDMLKPLSPMPIMILGGKGSGKTHIMRYYSYNIQKIRYSGYLHSKIQEDKYFGIYLRCGGLNSTRFMGQGISADIWKSLFSYYIELWFTQLLIDVLIDYFKDSQCISPTINEQIISEIKTLFQSSEDLGFGNLCELKATLSTLQRELDYEINNLPLREEHSIRVKILVTSGKLIFGIPKIVSKYINELKSFQYIFLIDEYENIEEEQQRYINTLIRERESPVTFRVGARKYGVRTYKTYSGREELKNGSEYEKVIVDDILREDKKGYRNFCENLCLQRIKQNFEVEIDNSFDIQNWFEDFQSDEFQMELEKKANKYFRKHVQKLETNLKKIGVDNKQIEKITSLLKVNNNYLLEKANVYLFYKGFKAKKEMLSLAEEIYNECQNFLNDKDSEQHKVLNHFKQDFIDQLHREAVLSLPYYGFSKIVKMSSSIPRLFLMMMKNIYSWSVNFDEHPYNFKRISRKAQLYGIEEASDWFYDDAKASGNVGTITVAAIQKICQLIQEIRFSDLPNECALSSFSIKNTDVDSEIGTCLNYLEQYSYIIKVASSRGKNSPNTRITYQINSILAPKWEIAISKRGVLHLTSEEVSCIFKNNSNTSFEFDKIIRRRQLNYNFPFNTNFKSSTEPSLFDF
ncbi:hypothetical protein I6I98_13020 [Sphingobacterium multivorum]|uniref:ATP-binding protein n=1 Tax=Sphingobacterium multivorum TaxID=28454 RepID=A0ABX7CWM7_SPHMU|nr:hypothetical protein [Sphingobacterium multivorum]QQT56124.1 hypothetical protein I6I98_13020 [Sphingobacterium multivorum]